MTNLMNTITNTLSGVALFAFGCLLAVVGFAAIGTLALFALAAVGIALLASPFVAMAQPKLDEADDTATV